MISIAKQKVRLTEMSDQKPSESVQDFLDRREVEELRAINSLYENLRPHEASLDEIRRAKRVLGIPPLHLVVSDSGIGIEVEVPLSAPSLETSSPTLGSPTLTENPPASSRQSVVDSNQDVSIENHRRAAEANATGQGYFIGHAGVTGPSPYQHLTMKQLVTRALAEHFKQGATAKQLREFIRDVWGRDIPRANLSPQLSRLKGDGYVRLNEETGIWSLARVELSARVTLGLRGMARVTSGSNQSGLSEHEKRLRAEEAETANESAHTDR
jgi:hypothetical protein